MKNILKFDFSNFRGDFFGGLTAGIVALPLALAFGEQTELGAIAGLYGAIALGVLAAFFGGTPIQVSGPTAPMTVVSAVVISDSVAHAGSVEAAFPMIIATFFLAGLIEALLGILRLGKYIRFIPYSVVSGFMSGIGVIIVITQIFPFFGFHAPEGGPLGTLRALHEIPEIANAYSLGIAVLTIAIIYLFPKISKVVPGTLVALLLLSVVAFFLIPEGSVIRLNSAGPIPTGLPTVYFDFFGVFSDFKNFELIAEYAVTLAFLGAIDSLLTSVVADNITKTKHGSDQELIGQGIGNIGAALIGGLPGAGATMRTVINARSGGKTKISGIIAGLFLLVVLLGAGSIVGYIPNAVLAGILITVGISIIDYKGLKHLTKIPRSDAFVMITVLLLTVFVDLLVAVAAGMVIAALMFMKKISDVVDEKASILKLKDYAPEAAWADEQVISREFADKVFVKHLDGPLFFGFANKFQARMLEMPETRIVIIRMDRVPYIDQTGMYALEDSIQELHKLGVKVAFVGLNNQEYDMLRGINLIPGLVPDALCFKNFPEAVQWVQDYLKGKNIENSGESETPDFREI